MTKKDQKFLFYLLVSIFLTLGLTISLQPLLAQWVAPNTSPPNVVNNLGTPITSESGDLSWYFLNKPTYVGEDFTVDTGGSFAYFHVDTADPNIPYVGIGTDVPAAELHVTSEDPGRGWTAVRIENTASADSEWELRAMDNADSDFIIWGGHEGATDDRLVINGNTGNISIGHTNPGIAKMDIEGDIHLRGSLPDPLTDPYDFVQLNVLDAGSDYSEIRWGHNDALVAGTDKFRFIWDSDPDIGVGDELEIITIEPVWGGTPATRYGRVGINDPNPSETMTINGTISAQGALIPYISDRRLKDINGNFEMGLDLVLKLKPVYFNYKKDNPLNIDSSQEHIGLIAQDLEKIIPEAIIERESGYKTYKTDQIDWALVNAVKELKEILCDLNPANEICISK